MDYIEISVLTERKRVKKKKKKKILTVFYFLYLPFSSLSYKCSWTHWEFVVVGIEEKKR